MHRKIVLLFTSFPVYPTIEGLINIQSMSLPPSTTSMLQPMDQGVIRSLKAHYKKELL